MVQYRNMRTNAKTNAKINRRHESMFVNICHWAFCWKLSPQKETIRDMTSKKLNYRFRKGTSGQKVTT